MITIWKYELAVTDFQKVSMPAGAKLLHVAGQDVEESTLRTARAGMFPMLWALVESDALPVDRIISVVGTGHPCLGPYVQGEYVGTAICGPLVWHVFDNGERPT